jgi:hypothetical protein
VDENPNTLDTRTISRVGVAGALLGVVAVALFIGLWIGLGSLGWDVFPRLVAAVCVPPGVLSAIVGGYILVTSFRVRADE